MFWNSIPGQQIKEASKTRWWVSFLQLLSHICQSVLLLFFLLCGVSYAAMPSKLCGSHLKAGHGKQHMDGGRGRGCGACRLGRMSLLKNYLTDLESLGTNVSIIQHIKWPFSVHPTLATAAPLAEFGSSCLIDHLRCWRPSGESSVDADARNMEVLWILLTLLTWLCLGELVPTTRWLC